MELRDSRLRLLQRIAEGDSYEEAAKNLGLKKSSIAPLFSEAKRSYVNAVGTPGAEIIMERKGRARKAARETDQISDYDRNI